MSDYTHSNATISNSNKINPVYPTNEKLTEDYIHKLITDDVLSVTAQKGKIPVADPETGMIDSFIAAGKENAKKQRRAVYQLDMEDNILNKFESVTAAAKYIGVSYSSGIFAVLSGRERTAHGYRWKYVSDKVASM